MSERVIVVHLRRPRLNDPKDSRRDPFWEFGSFGLTGCHSKNLMHPKRADELKNARLAFMQGGQESMKLVFLSPPVRVIVYDNDIVEARWKPTMPFKFTFAPLVINNSGKTLFPKLKQTFESVSRDTWVRKFSSKYRTKSSCLPDLVAREVINVFDGLYVGSRLLAETYEQALPCLPPKIDRDRLSTYQELLSKARHNIV